jgi:hypothetical protein
VAILYRAQLTPSKMELLSAWVPLQPWCGTLADLRTLDPVGAYRFDDPEDEVGIETHLLRSGDGQVIQVPLTYRGAALDGAGPSLITTIQHSVLGERWVYDACGDPTYAQALATAIVTGGTQADLDVVTDGGYERREATTKVAGSGSPGSAVPHVGPVAHWNEGKATIIRSGNLEMTVLRVIDEPSTGNIPGVSVLTGTWPGQDTPAYLASARST